MLSVETLRVAPEAMARFDGLSMLKGPLMKTIPRVGSKSSHIYVEHLEIAPFWGFLKWWYPEMVGL